jgi:hypothetical protein
MYMHNVGTCVVGDVLQEGAFRHMSDRWIHGCIVS